ncbi:MAG: hypothetical protein K6V36_07820 [Anaerolineae bacterium]|nr:hypothetical protein [Anaerolineae bacterium]
MRAASGLLVVLLVFLLAASCEPAAAPVLAPTETPVPTPVLEPSATAPGEEQPLAAPYANVAGRWGLGYIPSPLGLGERDGRWVRFTGPQGVLVAIESDVTGAGEALGERARAAVAEVFPGAVATGSITPAPDAFWEVGITFTAADGVRGEALYAQPGRHGGDYRVFGFLFACPEEAWERLRPELETMRASFRPVGALPLVATGTDEQLWLVYTYGFRGFGEGPGQEHWLAVYTVNSEGYRRVSHAVLESPDYVDPSGVRQVFLGGDPPTRLWIEVASGVGAHGGCYDLFMYDWQHLTGRVSHCHSSPGAGEVSDIDGDGVPEVVLNESDEYVFCYACNVRYVAWKVLRCDEQGCGEVTLSTLPDSVPAEVRALSDQAVALAKAGLWRDAQAAIEQALASGVYEPTLAANAALIRLHAGALERQVREGGYPLLAHVFYGDYEAALALMRPLKPVEVWGPNTPLVRGTLAEGYEANLAEWLTRATSSALEAKPDLAGAYFLRGWASYLRDPSGPNALADVRRAAELAPGEGLFAESLAYLEGR